MNLFQGLWKLVKCSQSVSIQSQKKHADKDVQINADVFVMLLLLIILNYLAMIASIDKTHTVFTAADAFFLTP